jgi:hypothetical protein
MLNNVFEVAKQSLVLSGDLAEFGVFRGDSAEAICRVKMDRPLHLFDTFEGLPGELFEKVDKIDKHSRKYMWANAYRCEIDQVKDRLKSYPEVYFYKGLFEDTCKQVMDKRFCFVHLDADLYRSIFDGIAFFHPRLVNGGSLLIHNYDDFVGVRNAVSSFFEEQQIIKMKHKHCLIIKRVDSK